MQERISSLKEEHVKIKEVLNEIGQFISGGNSVDYRKFGHFFKKLSELWDSHEKKEEILIKEYAKINNNFSGENDFLEQHKQLRIYWNSIKRALQVKDCEKLALALDTDGRILLEKFNTHMDIEERVFETISASS